MQGAALQYIALRGSLIKESQRANPVSFLYNIRRLMCFASPFASAARRAIAFFGFNPAMQREGNEKNWNRNWVVRRLGRDFKLKRLHVEPPQPMIPLLELYNQPLPASVRFCALAFDHPPPYICRLQNSIPKLKKFKNLLTPTNLGWFSNV